MKTFPLCLLLLLPAAAYADSYTTTQVCSQTNPTVGATTDCQSNSGTSISQSSMDANVGSGTFSGSSLAKSSNGSLGVATSVTLNDYNAASNVFLPGAESAPNMTSAQATWTDTVTFTGLPSTYNLTITYLLDGSFSSDNAYISSALQVLTNIFDPDGNGIGFAGNYYNQSTNPSLGVPSTITQTFTDLSSSTIEENINLLASTGIPVLTSSEVPIYDDVYLYGSGSADFGHTLDVAMLTFTDANGNVINNVTADSTDGFQYQIASSSPVPEPSSLLLAGTGLTGLLVSLRRRIAAN